MRIFMCFEVVLCHFLDTVNISQKLLPFSAIRVYAVPCFMILSFYLFGDTLEARPKGFLKKRLLRLVWPLVGWAVIYAVVYAVFQMIYPQYWLIGGIESFFWQMLTGNSPLNASMWYQFSLIVITLLITVIVRENRNLRTYFLILLALIALGMEYSGANSLLFGSLRNELKYPLGRTIEMIPFAVMGLLLCYWGFAKDFSYIKNKAFSAFCGCGICVAFTVLLLKCNFPVPNGFEYGGIKPILISFVLFAFFAFLPLYHLPDFIQKLLSKLSGLTLGIYCIHRMVGVFATLVLNLLNIHLHSFWFCVFIYGISLVLSYFICLIPLEAAKKLVS